MDAKWKGSGRLLLATGVLAAAGVAAVGWRWGAREARSEEAVAWPVAATRSLEVRLSHPGVASHRPYHAVARGGGGKSVGVPLEVLARLEAQGDFRGLAAAYLLQGAPELAASYLERAGDSPEVLSDRAAVALARKDAAGALTLLDRAFQERPRLGPALWNRGLALRELELWAKSAEAFEAVEALAEPGWADEARTHAETMRGRIQAEQQGYKDAWATGAALVTGQGTVSAEQLRARPDLYRLFLYDAIRAAPTLERLQALWPVAETLDAHFGGSALRDGLRWAEARDFQRRAPLAALYLHVFRGEAVPGGLSAYLEKLRAAGELDILMGTLVLTQEVARDVEGYARLAEGTKDPWFTLIAAHERAKAAIRKGELFQAEQLLLAATRQCQGGTFAYRCGVLLERLGDVYRQLWRIPEATRSVREARALYRRSGFWASETDFLLSLGQFARLQGQGVLARALLDEALAYFPEDCSIRQFVRANDALALLEEMRVEEARGAIGEALQCGTLKSILGAMTLAELARLRPEPTQDGRLLEALEARRRAGRLDPGARVILSHIEGRFLIEHERARGEEVLRRTITEAEALPRTSAEAREARAYSYASLLFAAGKGGEWSQVLALLEQEAGGALPRRCLVAVTVDRERTLALAFGPEGRMQGFYDGGRTQPLGVEARGIVPEALVAPLSACEQVDVLARPPLHGRAGLLPDALAWRYLTPSTARAVPGAAPARHVVVKDVEAPAALELPRLGAWRPVGEGITVLSGADATPGRVLEAMTRATEIEIHAHGLINPTLSDASLLVLSPDAGGRYALTAGEVRAHRLEGAPLVTLAACRAAHTAQRIHEPFSLPAAFLEAGARTVLAATVDIPDAEAGPFFVAVQERIRAGQRAAVALRDVRQEWLRRDAESWARSVLVFE
ncbi:CHAT domain-containing protein [Hyalangium rubrum]|uniref:CHAT domain-containing protein n=1 Tax=Hyalangium rubrum TaxID=3103134 RepID=A0ABU5HM15_9BACT|nr:CHAT domain-containing protein [Hyalangium sp. s54d21]MDY7233155.1 CHAT domain-containing protein [Hyalangium sp. s54d21]